MSSDNRLVAVLAICAAVVLIATVFAAPGCNEEASVKCPNGVSYSISEWGGAPNLSAAEAEHFCEGRQR